MMGRKFGISVSAVLALAMVGLGSFAHGAERMSSRSMVALSPQAADEKARDDLLSILQSTGRFDMGNRVAVSSIGMRTVPHGTNMLGFCVMDLLRLEYSSIEAKPDPKDERRRPTGLEVNRLFRAANTVAYLDDRYPTDRAEAIANASRTDCEKLQFEKTAVWFSASNLNEAVDAVNALHAALDALRSGRVDAKNCDYSLKKTETCGQAIQRAARLDQISAISHDCRAGPNQSCLDLYLDFGSRMVVSVVFSLKNNSPTPEDVISVRAGEFAAVD